MPPRVPGVLPRNAAYAGFDSGRLAEPTVELVQKFRVLALCFQSADQATVRHRYTSLSVALHGLPRRVDTTTALDGFRVAVYENMWDLEAVLSLPALVGLVAGELEARRCAI